jgi:hypothetical protein
VDLYGANIILEEFGNVIARGGSGRRHRVAVPASTARPTPKAKPSAGPHAH